MNYQINIAQMRKKTEIETNLLEQINFELKYCMGELKNIYLTQKLNLIELDDNSKIYDICKIFVEHNIDLDIQNKFIEKFFAHVEHTYYAFLYFYMKKKDFMGMNLTGLIQGKMETGLGFRNSLDKLSQNTIKIKYPNLSNIIEKNGCEVWKIKSNNFGWIDYKLDLFTNVLVVSNSKDNSFYLLVEKN